VLEHVPEPNETLQSIYSLLAVSGLLLIAVPNYLSYDAKHYQSQWAGYDLPRHLWHFNKISMTQLLTKHGFKIAKIHPMKLDAYYVSLLRESYLHPGRPKLIHAMNAFISGLTSNLSASGSGEFSSLIYLATKA
jgi:2-polyprenyl-3-methyl-5-hydroxy-6-metoxy-1,4-benzoquinol methylase